MNVLAAIILIGASGSATATREYDQEISGILVRVAWGAVSDVLGSDSRRPAWGLDRILADLEPRLTIDGKPRTGWRSWAEAAWRVVGFISERTSTGSVGYSYRVRLRAYEIRRETRIADDTCVLITDAWWTETVQVIGRIKREIPIHVQIILRASERGGTTTIVGTATGFASTADFRCRLVRNRRAEPEATVQLQKGLAAALATIEQTGTDLYHGADEYTDILDRIGAGLRTIGRLRR